MIIEWWIENLNVMGILIFDILIWILLGGFFINLWEKSVEWWDKRFR